MVTTTIQWRGRFTIIVDEQCAINVQQAAVVTGQAKAPQARFRQIDLPSELQKTDSLD